MARTITVKGIGKASAKPDYAVLSLQIESKNEDYGKAMELAAANIQNLNELFCGVGFAPDDLKTGSFAVNTDYDHVKDRNGNYRQVFRGYRIVHELKLSFDFDTNRLAQALSAVAASSARPHLSVHFTVKDSTAINEEMLRSATVNARRKAEILCAASGAVLGELLVIDYNWGELSLYSRTEYEDDDCFHAMTAGAPASVDITPEDIDVSDTVAFVWELK